MQSLPYILDDTPQSIKIKRNSVMTLEFRNQPKGGVLVKKVDSVTNAPISDVEFLVTDSDGNLIGNANGKFVTDSAGAFTITDVAPGTTLIIKETRAKAGYILDDTPQTVKVKSNEVVTVEFRNAPKGNLIIVKQDSVTKEPLEGVEFKITYADGSYVDAKGGTLSSTGLYRTDKAGKITISGISGTVVVTEIETIPGYTIDENTRTQTVVVNPNDTQTLYFYNTPVGGLQIIKSDEDNHSERIPNTTFDIRKVDDALVDTVTTDKNGRVFVALEDGSYYAKEVTSNKSFRLDDTPHYFEIKDGKRVTLQVTNKKLSGIVIHKIDSATGEGIYGVKFVLYDANKKPIGEYTSDDEGYIYIDEIPGGLSGRFYPAGRGRGRGAREKAGGGSLSRSGRAGQHSGYLRQLRTVRAPCSRAFCGQPSSPGGRRGDLRPRRPARSRPGRAGTAGGGACPALRGTRGDGDAHRPGSGQDPGGGIRPLARHAGGTTGVGLRHAHFCRCAQRRDVRLGRGGSGLTTGVGPAAALLQERKTV